MKERDRRAAALKQADRHCDMEGLPPPSPDAVAAGETWVAGTSADAIVEGLKKRFTGARGSSVPSDGSEPRTGGGGD